MTTSITIISSTYFYANNIYSSFHKCLLMLTMSKARTKQFLWNSNKIKQTTTKHFWASTQFYQKERKQDNRRLSVIYASLTCHCFLSCHILWPWCQASHRVRKLLALLVKEILDRISVPQGGWQQADWYSRWWVMDGVCTEVPLGNLGLRFC